MNDRHPDDDLLVDLALSDVDEPQRDALTSHLAMCERCRTNYAVIADSMDHVLAAAPQVAPPPGFSKAVLDAMGVAATRRPVKWWRRPRAMLAGVAAVLTLFVGAAGSGVILDGSQDPAIQVPAVGRSLLTGDGASVGTVLESYYDGQPVLVVTVTDGHVGVHYDCQLVLADGTRQSGGSWVLPERSGVTWVIAQPEVAVTRLELVTDTGGTWATAKL